MAAIDAERALSLVGVPFRPQGRDAGRGLDCVGLCVAAYCLPIEIVRRNYRLRGDYRIEVKAALRRHFRRISGKQKRPGDLLLLAVAGDQLHLAVLTMAGFIHADAKLRRVVETPGDPEWPLIGVYRRRVRRTAGE
jgi:lipoprotein Spr